MQIAAVVSQMIHTLYSKIRSGYENRRIDDQSAEILNHPASRGIVLEEVTIEQADGKDWVFRLSKRADDSFVKADSEYRNIVIYTEDEQFLVNTTRFLLRTAFECRFCYEGIVSLHAACVEKDGYAVAFTGESGLGKSTRARAWVEGLGAEWISGDRPAVRLEKTGATACGVPWDGKEQIFRDVERPLKAIMEVRRSPANYVRKLSKDQARALLMKQTFVPMWDTDAAFMAMINVKKLIDKVPVYRVFCGPTAEDAREIYDILYNHPEKIREEEKEMKIKDGFVLRNVVDEYIVMPTGENIAKFDGAVVLNDVSAFVFEQMKNPVSKEDVLNAILNEFEVDEATATAAVEQFVAKLKEQDFLG